MGGLRGQAAGLTRPDEIDEAAATPLKFAERVGPGESGRPAALGAIVGFGYGYARDDGAAAWAALRP